MNFISCIPICCLFCATLLVVICFGCPAKVTTRTVYVPITPSTTPCPTEKPATSKKPVKPRTTTSTTKTLPTTTTLQPRQQYAACGSVPRHNNFIAKDGNLQAKTAEIPWQVRFINRLYINVSDIVITRLCGGALVFNNETIVTSASCLNDIDISNITVFLGSNNEPAQIPNSPGVIGKVKRVVVHPLYSRGQNDVAVVKIAPIAISDNIVPICLPVKCASIDSRSTSCVTTGWLGPGGKSVSRLQKGSSKQVEQDRCRRLLDAYGQSITQVILENQMMCAKSASESRCQADFGGPLACRNNMNGRYELEGILRAHLGCEERSRHVDLYTRPCKYSKFIIKEARRPVTP